MIRVGVFHDQTVFRIGLELLIEEQHDMCVVTGADSSPSALESLDIVVAGGSFAEPQSVRLLIGDRGRATPAVVVLLEALDPEAVERRLRAGARGVVGSRASPATLALAIRSVASGAAWCDPRVAPPAEQGPKGWSRLTRRERQVAELIADGMRYNEIAGRLGISGHTVRNHARSIFEKLDIGNRVELVAVLAEAFRRR